MRIARCVAIAIPLAIATAALGGIASADGRNDGGAMPVSVFCNNPTSLSLVDAGGGNGGLLGQVAKGLGVGVGGPGSIGGGNPMHQPNGRPVPPPPGGDNNGGDGTGLGLAGNHGSANGGDGGHAEQSTNQYVAGNRCATGPETHISHRNDVQVFHHSFNDNRKTKIIGREH
ncbi:hypothetical protein OHA44_22310 [Streptomyces sp. NBC_00144]|uniref:hypothetical protein n=1 Tax=unclassified Streptomyces TaxID=2593676 RepID=UPI003247C7A1